MVVQDHIRYPFFLVKKFQDIGGQLGLATTIIARRVCCRVEERYRLDNIDEPEIQRNGSSSVGLAFASTPVVRCGECLDGDRSTFCILEHGLKHRGLESVVVPLPCVESGHGGVVLDHIVSPHIDQIEGVIRVKNLVERSGNGRDESSVHVQILH